MNNDTTITNEQPQQHTKPAARPADFRYRSGSVSISVWVRSDDGPLRFSGKVQKSWRTRDTGEWVTTDKFSEDDYLDLAHVAAEAKRWCASHRADFYANNRD